MDQDSTPTVMVSLTVKDAANALDFYTAGLGALELFRMPAPDGSVAHAEFMVGNTRLYISGEAEAWHAYAMPEGTMASCLFSIGTDDCGGAYQRALNAGATSLSEPQDQFWGTRSALIKDPYGYRWAFNQVIEEVPPEELEKRAKAFFASQAT